MEVNEKLADKWEFTMNTIWNFIKAYSQVEPSVNFSKAEESVIAFRLNEGVNYKIKCFFINNSFLQLEVTADEEPDFVASVTHINRMGEKEIIQILSSILTYCECIKP